MAEQLANNAASTLTAAIPDAVTTSCTVANGTVFPATGNFRVIIDTELLLCTARSGNTLTVTRGIELTTAASHANGAPITHVLTVAGLNQYVLENSGRASYGTTPPASPADGDEWILPADATNGVMWQFRYRAASASAYKWEFIGGPPLVIYIVTTETTTTTGAWVDLTTVGPAFTAPRGGDYLFAGSVDMFHS